MSDGTSGIPVVVTLTTDATATSTAQARAAIERLTAATVQPLLSTEDIDALVELAKCPDVDGYIPSDSNWTATWDIARAVLEGWRIKLGKASAMHNFNDGGVSMSRQQVFANIEGMINLWERKAAFSVRVTSEREIVDSDETYL